MLDHIRVLIGLLWILIGRIRRIRLHEIELKKLDDQMSYSSSLYTRFDVI